MGVGMLEGTTGVNWKFMGTSFVSFVDRSQSPLPPPFHANTEERPDRPPYHTTTTLHNTGVTFASWAVTLLIMGGGTALLFAQGVYAPCVDVRGV